jgi:hypothetical protein
MSKDSYKYLVTDAANVYKQRLEILENRFNDFDMSVIEVDTRYAVNVKELNQQIFNLNKEIRVIYNYMIASMALTVLMFVTCLIVS